MWNNFNFQISPAGYSKTSYARLGAKSPYVGMTKR